MPDKDGYPTEEELQRVREWDAIKDPKGLAVYLGEIWEFKEFGYAFTEEGGKWTLELHTGGWSGNEEIIGALHENGDPVGFWFWYWRKSTRGGHYWFDNSNFKEARKK